MCGIVGAFGPAGARADWLSDACDTLRYRGPDDRGIWSDASAGIALGQTRLAILDLSSAGHQPMSSLCGRYVVVFNGEIYNHLELRDQLSERPWRGHSDTETLLECLLEWGVERTLQSLVGMFAFAAFDRKAGRLVLARDRFGEKPLYYGYAGDALVFGSVLTPLRLAPGFDSSIDRQSLSSYLQQSFVPAPRTIYSSMRKLPPGTFMQLTHADIHARRLPTPAAYWNAVDVALAAERSPLDVDDVQATAMLEQVLGQAVKGQMLSDVPLGAFLSGGIDSSTVVALMQRNSVRKVQTFSVGFEDSEYDESPAARAVARHLGTDHVELVVRAADALEAVPLIPSAYDEPFADSSQIPTMLVARLARQHVKVALSGDGGDELFGGYNRHVAAMGAWPRLARLPLFARSVSAQAIRTLSPAGWDGIASATQFMTPARRRVRAAGEKLYKVADVLECETGDQLYRRLTRQVAVGEVVLGAGIAGDGPSAPLPAAAHVASQMMLMDATHYLPDDILVKVDRAAMAVSLETRVPMLDHRVFELAWRLPMHTKIRNGRGKWLLRQLLYRYVPQELVERPKAGFAIPLAAWLRKELRPWVEQLLAAPRLRSAGYLDERRVSTLWREHLSGRRDWHTVLWNILMFEAWRDAQQ
jgi:asparagine synthase (glutamine-hydrolysing)